MGRKEDIRMDRLPGHVAIIMDGNGRWAKKRGNRRIFGHQNGVKSVRETVEASAELGINYLTLYAFSRENWSRPENEINALMNLLVSTIDKELDTLLKNDIKLLTIGDLEGLPQKVQEKIQEIKNKTEHNKRLNLVLALNYSARWELMNAMSKFGKDIQQNRVSADVDITKFRKYITTGTIPDPDLLIRTSGEFRLSNFLLWQIAYTELYFTEILWPDFRKDNFYDAILDYQKRERRFGKTSDQLDIQNPTKNDTPQHG
ncbi:MAG: isoprenyl transferase [Bacteroidota bacterium]